MSVTLTMVEYRELLNREFNLLQSKATLSVALGFWQDSQKLQSFMSHTLCSQENCIGIVTQCNHCSHFGRFICERSPHMSRYTCRVLTQPPRKNGALQGFEPVVEFQTYVSTIKPFPLADNSRIKMQFVLSKFGKFPNQISLFGETCSIFFANAEATALVYVVLSDFCNVLHIFINSQLYNLNEIFL